MTGHLTALQQRMLAAGEVAQDPELEVLHLEIEMPVGLDPERLYRAWNSACARHEILRTEMLSGQAARPPELVTIRDGERATLSPLIGADRAPYRITWSPRSDGTSVWTWTVHHAVADTRTIELVACEAFARYAGTVAPLPSSGSYADAVEALTAELSGDATACFWSDALAAHHSRITVPALMRGHRISQAWQQDMLEGNDGGAKTSTLVLASAALLAAEITGERTVVIGNVYDQRRILPPNLQDVAGPLISVLPLCIPVDPETRIDQFLHQVRGIDLAARQHLRAEPPDNAPGDWVICVNYQPLDWRGRICESIRDALGATPGRIELVRRSALPLVLDVDAAEGFACRLDTWSELYGVERVSDLALRASDLLRALVQPVANLVGDLARTSVAFGPQRFVPAVGVHELIGEVVTRTPDAPALSFEGQTISYRQLDERSGRLAAVLQRHGARPGARVALCLPRGIDVFVALLAVIRCGAAYVPLDPEYPRKRLDYVLADTSASFVVTSSGLASLFPDSRTVEVDRIVTSSELAVRTTVTPDDVAYVIHTSGSTGRPKGVEVTHGSLVNLVFAQRDAFGVTPDDRVLQFASLSFDASVSEVFVTWAAGACLVVAPSDGRVGDGLQSTLSRYGVTLATLPPTALSDLDPAANPGLSTLITAGEPCPRWLVDRWGAGRRLINAYGPTEATVCATTAELSPGDDVVIGRPIANVAVYVLDEQARPVSIGAIGEIYIGGDGVARGYLGRPALTDERFVRDPFGGGRMYRTGDMARMRVDGTTEFLGRNDDQVKIRGHRIELGELESLLAEHPAVTVAVAVIVNQQLFAYVVPVVPEGLSEWIAGSVPAHLVPAALLPLSQVPVGPSGKVDRLKLAAAAQHPRVAQGLAPRTPLEARLAQVWAEVLGLDRVGVDDNFFDLGGSSLEAARILARCRAEGAFDSPLMATTVAEQAKSRRQTPRSQSSLPMRNRQTGNGGLEQGV